MFGCPLSFQVLLLRRVHRKFVAHYLFQHQEIPGQTRQYNAVSKRRNILASACLRFHAKLNEGVLQRGLLPIRWVNRGCDAGNAGST